MQETADGAYVAQTNEIPCNYTTVCDADAMDTSLISYRVDTTGDFYVHNWIEQMSLQCVPSEYMGFIGSFGFFGAVLSCVVLPVFADKFGRYSVYLITITLQLPIYVLNNTAKTLIPEYIVSFLLGVALLGRFTAGFILLLESVPQKHKALAGTALAVGDTAAQLYVTFFLRFISRDSQTVIWIGMGLNFVALIATFWNVESPAWLVSVGETEKAKKNILYIAKFNGIQDIQITHLKPDDIGENKEDNE